MATRKTELLIDDLTGVVLESGGQTVRFGLDDIWYEVDLADDNAAALRNALEPYLRVARRAPRVTALGRRYGR